MKNLTLTLLALLLTVVSFAQAPAPIGGPSGVCMGVATTYTDTSAGGAWSVSSTGIATISPVGILTGVSLGIVVVSYTTGGGTAIITVTVNPVPVPVVVSGSANICPGSVTTVSDGTAGGAWSSGSTAVATVNPSTGVVGGVTPGLATITYSLTTGCSASIVITVNAPCPGPGMSPHTVCSGSSVTMSGCIPGGTWSSSNPAIATIGSSTGSLGGVTPGTATITFTLGVGCSVTSVVTVNASPTPITGPSTVCAGSEIPVSAFPGGGTWSSSDVAVATVSPGSVIGVAAGVANIFYTSPSGCYSVKPVTVMSAPGAISGPGNVCIGATIPLTDPVAGGTWTSSNVVAASIGSVSGIVTGGTVSVPTAVTIYYSIGSCAVSKVITINPSPVVYTLTGGAYCAGGTGAHIILDGSDIGVYYQLYRGSLPVGPLVAGTGSPLDWGLFTVVDTYGVVANPASACESVMAGPAIVTINPLPAAITGVGRVCPGLETALSDAAGGGVWSSVNSSVATVDSLSGVVTGHSAGTTGISYTLATGCSVQTTITVNPSPGPITGSTAICLGSSSVLGDATPGGTWSTSNPAIATYGTAGVTGSSVGTATITYTGPIGCYTTTGVTVNAIPTLSSPLTPAGVCSYSTFSYSPSGSVSGASFVWSRATVAGISNPAATGSGDPHEALINTTGGDIAVIYAYTVSAAGCNNTQDVTVTVYHLPAAYTVTGGGGYCAGGAGSAIGLPGSEAGVSYQLFSGGVPTGMAMAGTGSSLDFGLHTAAGTYTVLASNTATGCSNNMTGTAVISINPLPTIYTITGTTSYCSGTPGASIGLSGSGIGATYILDSTGVAGYAIPGSGSSLSFGPHHAGTYTAHAISVAGCTSVMAGSVTVTEIPSVTTSVSISATTGDTICSGTVVLYSAVPVGGGGSPTFGWTVNGIGAGAGPTYTYTPDDGDVVGVTMTSSAACATPLVTTGGDTMTVFPSPTPISGGTHLCIGSSLTLIDGTPGGTWDGSSGIATVATIGASTGVVTGFSAGIDTIIYTLGGGCYATTTVTISTTPGVSAGFSEACGGVYTMTASGASSYSWSPATGLSCATCAVAIVNPTTTTSYVVTGMNAAGCSDTAVVTINGNRISGHISLGASGPIRVWLIQFNTVDSSISALDSTMTCVDGGSPYYEFSGVTGGNYMVKANLLGGVPGLSGYIPTYSLSSAHWDSAATVAHSGATDTMHINMVYGTVPSGPGFISGYVGSGAGKGTSSAIIPAPGMLIYLLDAATGNVLTYNYTDESGNYSFSGLGYGDYIIYPEAFQYTTTPSAAISINASSETVTGVNFRQRTAFRTIVPYSFTAVKSISSSSGLSVYPNPASGSIFIKWQGQATGNAAISLTDVMGREVYRSAITMYTATGEIPVALDGVKNGIYLLTIRNTNINFSAKLVKE